MEDVGRAPEPSKLSPATEPASIPTLDGWIESLMACKQLAEVDVQRLCEKVRLSADVNGVDRASRISSQSKWCLLTRHPGTRGLAGRVKRATCGKLIKPQSSRVKLTKPLEMPRHSLRRYSWPVSRFDGAIQNWRTKPRYQLSLHG